MLWKEKIITHQLRRPPNSNIHSFIIHSFREVSVSTLSQAFFWIRGMPDSCFQRVYGLMNEIDLPFSQNYICGKHQKSGNQGYLGGESGKSGKAAVAWRAQGS